MNIAVSRNTLGYYSSMLATDGTGLEKACTPVVVLDSTEPSIRVQSIKTGDGSEQLTEGAEAVLNNFGQHMLRRTLIDNRSGGFERAGTLELDGKHKTLGNLFMLRGIITGELKSLSISPMSPSDLGEVVDIPELADVKNKQYVEPMDSYFLLLAKLKVSRKIGYIATGIRLTEFDSQMSSYLVNKPLHELNENNELVSGPTRDPLKDLERIYSFITTIKIRKDTETSDLADLTNSLLESQRAATPESVELT